MCSLLDNCLECTGDFVCTKCDDGFRLDDKNECIGKYDMSSTILINHNNSHIFKVLYLLEPYCSNHINRKPESPDHPF